MKKILKKYIALTTTDTSFLDKRNIVKTWEENDIDAAIEFVDKNGLNDTYSGNMNFPHYYLVKLTEIKEHGTICTKIDYIKRGFTLKKDTIEKYNLTEVDDYLDKNYLWSVYSMLHDFHIPYINVKIEGGETKHYTNFDKLKELIEAVNIKQQPLVIEGTNWPYWFNFGGELIYSETSDWFKYLQIKFDYVSPNSLVTYTGEDQYEKHLNKK